MFLFCLIGSSIQAQETSQMLTSFIGASPVGELDSQDNNGMPPMLILGTDVLYKVDMKIPTGIQFSTATFRLGTTAGADDIYSVSVSKSVFTVDFEGLYYLIDNQLGIRTTTLGMVSNVFYEVKLFDNQGNCSYHTTGSLQ